MNNHDLIQAIKSGRHAEAISALYQEFPKVRSFILSNGGTRESAKDVFQDALIILCRNAAKEGFSLSSSPGTYLFSVCKYIWKDRLAKQNRHKAVDPGELDIPDMGNELEFIREKERRLEFIQAVMGRLGDRCRMLLEAFYFQKRSMAQIADELHFSSEKIAKNQKYKCLERARKIVKEEYVSASETIGK